ncbi:MAG: 5'-nucleotidase C-terminal domain-containing protein, partial [Candidatus Cryptobacteroides sp.]
MKKIFIAVCALCLAVSVSQARDFKWRRDAIDGSRTGVTVPGKDNVKEVLGEVSGNTWKSPSGRVFTGGGAPKVAALVIAAQPAMSIVKEVVGYAPEDMVKQAPESSLTNWYIDNFMAAAEEITGRHVDFAIGNFGGVRVNIAAGDVLYDDIRSMFPFRNQVVYIPVKGSDVLRILEGMAATKIEILGGVRIVVSEKKLLRAEIGGEP